MNYFLLVIALLLPILLLSFTNKFVILKYSTFHFSTDFSMRSSSVHLAILELADILLTWKPCSYALFGNFITLELSD